MCSVYVSLFRTVATSVISFEMCSTAVPVCVKSSLEWFSLRQGLQPYLSVLRLHFSDFLWDRVYSRTCLCYVFTSVTGSTAVPVCITSSLQWFSLRQWSTAVPVCVTSSLQWFSLRCVLQPYLSVLRLHFSDFLWDVVYSRTCLCYVFTSVIFFETGSTAVPVCVPVCVTSSLQWFSLGQGLQPYLSVLRLRFSDFLWDRVYSRTCLCYVFASVIFFETGSTAVPVCVTSSLQLFSLRCGLQPYLSVLRLHFSDFLWDRVYSRTCLCYVFASVIFFGTGSTAIPVCVTSSLQWFSLRCGLQPYLSVLRLHFSDFLWDRVYSHTCLCYVFTSVIFFGTGSTAVPVCVTSSLQWFSLRCGLQPYLSVLRLRFSDFLWDRVYSRTCLYYVSLQWFSPTCYSLRWCVV